MTRYVVEIYTANARDAVVQVRSDAATLAGTAGLRHLRAIFVPNDETCFHLVDGTSADDVAAAADGARVSFERVVEAVEVSCPTDKEEA
jgi:hypothetical protein